MAHRHVTRTVLAAYAGLVLAAAVLGALRLHQSTEMPGLAAIELVLLSLPWSLTLAVNPVSRLGWGAMAGIVLGGVALNALLLRALANWTQPRMN